MKTVASILNPAEIVCLRAIMAIGSVRAATLVAFHAQVFEQESVPSGLSKKQLRALDKPLNWTESFRN